VISFIETDDQMMNHEIDTKMIHRHLAWINALRVQLRPT